MLSTKALDASSSVESFDRNGRAGRSNGAACDRGEAKLMRALKELARSLFSVPNAGAFLVDGSASLLLWVRSLLPALQISTARLASVRSGLGSGEPEYEVSSR